MLGIVRSRTFWALATGLYLNAVVYGVSAAALRWVPVRGAFVSSVLLALSPLCLSVGTAAAGVAADRVGRRHLIRWAPVGYLVGALVIAAASHLAGALAGSAALLVTAGIDSNTILTYGQEVFPERQTRLAMYAQINFVNLGGLTLAILVYCLGLRTVAHLRGGIAGMIAFLALITLFVRRGLAESPSWGTIRRHHSARPPLDGLRMGTAIAFSFSNTAGFSLLTYALAAQAVPAEVRTIMVTTTAAGFGAGLFTVLFAPLAPRLLLVSGYSLALAAALALLSVGGPHRPTFWWFMVALSAFTSMTYLAEDTFKSSWPTPVRSRRTAFVRVMGLAAYAGLVFALQTADLHHFLLVVAGVWALGWVASVIWLVTGSHP